MMKLLMYIKFVANNRKKARKKYIKILPAPTEGITDNFGEDLHY